MTYPAALPWLITDHIRRQEMTVRRIRPGRRMSEAVIHGDRVYLSGLTADPPTGSAAE